MSRRLQPAHTRRCTQEDSKVDVLWAASAPREHTPTERMFWGANRKGELGKRLQREVKTHTCTSSLTAQKKMGIKRWACWTTMPSFLGPAAGSIGTSDLKLV